MAYRDTSREAYRRSRRNIGGVRRRMLAAINEAQNAGRHGATSDEVEAITGIPHQTCSAEMGRLRDEGVLETFGLRRNTVRGVPADVYRLAFAPHGPAPEQRKMI